MVFLVLLLIPFHWTCLKHAQFQVRSRLCMHYFLKCLASFLRRWNYELVTQICMYFPGLICRILKYLRCRLWKKLLHTSLAKLGSMARSALPYFMWNISLKAKVWEPSLETSVDPKVVWNYSRINSWFLMKTCNQWSMHLHTCYRGMDYPGFLEAVNQNEGK